MFDSGREVPEVTNQAPAVTAVRDASQDGNLSTRVVGTFADDGVPYDDELTYGWETVSAPAGAGVIFADPKALATRVTGTVEGDYVFRFFADDGEKRSTATVSVTLAKKAVAAEFGASATITSSGSASWENQNARQREHHPGQLQPRRRQRLGQLGPAEERHQPGHRGLPPVHLGRSPVRLSSTDIYWYDDNGGTRRPSATGYVIETSGDGTTWTPVTLIGGSSRYARRSEHQRLQQVQLRARSPRAGSASGSSA